MHVRRTGEHEALYPRSGRQSDEAVGKINIDFPVVGRIRRPVSYTGQMYDRADVRQVMFEVIERYDGQPIGGVGPPANESNRYPSRHHGWDKRCADEACCAYDRDDWSRRSVGSE